LFKKETNIKKAGILGILDPLASGILPIIVGEGTKFLSFIENGKKSYDVKCKLGIFSECGDFESEPISFPDEKRIIESLNENIIKDTFKSFIGDYLQIPPMYSNIKHKGKPLHSYARKNININRKAKKREIYDLKFIYQRNDIIKFSVVCSSGTYIRTLVQDISNKWNLHSCLYELHRTNVAPFYNHPSISLDDLYKKRIDEYIISIPEMLCELSEIVCIDYDINKLHNGLPIDNNQDFPDQTLCKVLDKNNNFHGVAITLNNSLYPKRFMKTS
tara:strand:+ start:7491 stop:8312 length:822 start_codon:yes stop_codon:yes gene_type:complete